MRGKIPLLLFFFCLSAISIAQDGGFVQVENREFVRDGKVYRFIGANYWYGMYLGMEQAPGDRSRLVRELDHLQELGVTNLRILGSSEGKGKYQISPTVLNSDGSYNENVLVGLDFFLDELGKRNMTAVVVLNNFWMWSGGMPQYVSWAEGSEIPLPDIENGGGWNDFISYSLKFYQSEKAQRMFRKHIKRIINRRNTVSGLKYKDDPCILSWQLANEPRGYDDQEGYRKWIAETSKFLNKKDGNHMISLGAEGNTSGSLAGIDLYQDNKFNDIDYATIHVWIQNWSWYNPDKPETFELAMKEAADYLDNQLVKAKMLNKPVVIEEFGVSRDGGKYALSSSTHYRNRFYDFVFDYTLENINNNGLVQGCNFWSWAGEGRPKTPGDLWQVGQDLIGDPPHERQGWYSVYNNDQSTIELIKKYSTLINPHE